MNTRTIYPRHEPAHYSVAEHTIETAPADLWPLIREWAYKCPVDFMILRKGAPTNEAA